MVHARYEITATLYKDDVLALHRVCRRDDGALFLLEEANDNPRSAAALAREHELLTTPDVASLPGIPRVRGLEPRGQGLSLLFDDLPGETLAQRLQRSGPLDLPRSLDVAVAVARTLGGLHGAQIVHKNVSPHQIIAHLETGTVTLLGFSWATRVPVERVEPFVADRRGRMLEYASPEMTGRANRPVDYRTDFYSLGVTLYELLTGSVPFSGRDALELAHCHLARRPRPVHDVVPGVPPIVSAIVDRLMAKSAEDRYQSASGLVADLETCRASMRLDGSVPPFELGRVDRPEAFVIPHRLYGRKAEIRALIDAFERVARGGTLEVLLVSGYGGIGKSSVVNELYRPIVERRGFFIAGKFDQFQRESPYSALIDALRQLVRNLLAGDEHMLASWKGRLLAAFEGNGQVIADVIPDIELIVGKQAPVAALGPAETRNRFNLVFQRFIRVFARSEHPLAVFLDDMQWADSATIELLQTLASDVDSSHLYVVLAYRDNEVDAAHPFVMAIDKLRGAGVRVETMKIASLEAGHVSELIADALRTDPETVMPLARLVMTKTAGNPFFVKEFLQALHRGGALTFDREAGAWGWDVAKIEAMKITDNVVELLLVELRALPLDVQHLLKIAACIGNAFALDRLALVAGKRTQELARELRPALRIDAVSLRESESGDTLLTFQHDRIQQAAYALLGAGEREEIHLSIGRKFLADLDGRVLEDSVFEIANQLDAGRDLITDPAERLRLAQLNILAGTKARASTAYAAARNYFSTAAELMGGDAWTSHYEMAFTAATGQAECAYLCGDHEVAEASFRDVIARSRSKVDKARNYALLLKLSSVAGRYREGVDLGREALAMFNVTIDGGPEAVQEELRLAEENMRGRTPADLLDAPLVSDPEVAAVIRLLMNLSPLSYIGRPEKFPLVCLKGLNHALRGGNMAETPFLYSAYSFLRVAYANDLRGAYEFSEMSLKLNERLEDITLRGTLLHLHGDHFNYWVNPIATNFPFLDRGFRTCLDAGDLVYSNFIAFEIIWQMFERGDSIAEIRSQSLPFAAFAKRTRNEPVFQTIRLQQQFLANLEGQTKTALTLDDDRFDEGACADVINKGSFGCGTEFYYIIKCIIAFNAGLYREALEHAVAAKPLLGAIMAMPIEATYHFYFGLTLAAMIPDMAGEEREQAIHEIREVHLHKLGIWAASCPANLENKRALLAAELARVTGHPDEAEPLYERAIATASESGFKPFEGLAWDLTGRFYRSRGVTTIAMLCAARAARIYRRWGARGLVQQLEARYSGLEALAPELQPVGGGPTDGSQSFDVLAITRAQHAISSEMLLSDLLSTLTRTLIESAGAEKVVLMLVRDERLEIVADASAGADPVIHAEPTSFESSAAVPHSIVHLVSHGRQPVIIEDASRHNPYVTDPYFKSASARSLLCMPILRKGSLVGVVVFENGAIAGLFTPERLSVLEALAAQAAISVENASLYTELRRTNDELEKRVEERTSELKQAQARLVEKAREAGMAEIASDVLHNVGNVLNSVVTNSAVMRREVEMSRVGRVRQTAALLVEHRHDLARFLEEDPRGSRVLDYLVALSTELEAEQTRLKQNLQLLDKHVDHIRAVVQAQQSHANSPVVLEECDLAGLLEDALSLQLSALQSNDVRVVRDVAAVPRVRLDKHKVLQILVNLIRNASQAMAEVAPEERHLRVRLGAAGGTARIEVTDSGVGIAPEHLPRLFAHGFTLRKDGHGFGLHWSALAAKTLGGTLSLESAGLGKGATARLEIPINAVPST